MNTRPGSSVLVLFLTIVFVPGFGMPTPNKLADEMIVEMNAISKLIENVETQAEFDSISSDLNQHGQKLTEIGNRFKAMQGDLTL